MILSHKYRLLPSARQHEALRETLEQQRILYNAALEERIGAYRVTKRGRTYMDQCKGLTEWRKSDESAAAVPANLQRWTLKRLDDAYRGFFDRVKRGGKVGFPRFRGGSRWNSFGFAEFSGINFDDKRLRWRTMPGGLRVHLHRPLPEGADMRSCVISRDIKGWSVSFQVKLHEVEKRVVERSVGIDLGLKVFAYQSDGVIIPPPRVARNAEKEMRGRQRALARCKRGSQRRKKVRTEVTRCHRKIVNTRDTFLHQQSARIVHDYDLIAVEDLRVANMVQQPTLARSISDASWSKFLGFLSYKAECAGSTLVRVNPRNTSQRCSGCQELVPKSLAARTHSCPHCGLVMDRDHNASLNILQAVVGLGGHNVTHQSERGRGNITLKEISK